MSTPTFDLSELVNGLTNAIQTFLGLLAQLAPFIITVSVVIGVVKIIMDKFSSISEAVTGSLGGGGFI
jgi:putative exporter of polyketide antibiotics